MIEAERIRRNGEYYRRMLHTELDADVWWAIQKMLDEFETGSMQAAVEIAPTFELATGHNDQLAESDGLSMGSLVFRCPVTRVEFASGIEVDVLSLTHFQDFPIQAFCPICRRHHQFRVKEGKLEPPKFDRCTSEIPVEAT